MSNENTMPIKVGITHGDFNGIGYEIIMKTLMEHDLLELCTPVVYGLHKVATAHRKALQIQDFNFFGITEAAKAAKHQANFISISEKEINVTFGESTAEAGEYAVKALELAMNDLQAGKIDVLVTAPINKLNVQSDKFQFPGHTEYLAQKTNTKDFLMLLVSGDLRVGVVSGHVPIQSLSNQIKKDKIVQKIRIMHQSLIKDFGIRKPKIAVLGLNPHAGDGGLIGKEEIEEILPAINEVEKDGILAFGPYSADGFFGSATYRKFDGILAMYHDQGLIPFKTLAFNHGVNFTAGLPIVRTSPDHGTGYDIAGKNKASEDSLREAIFMAIDIFRKRKEFAELSSNPLKITKVSHNDYER